MTTFLDLVIALGALIAAAYCLLLSRRLRALTQLDSELGSAIAVMSQQVDALTRALAVASQSSSQAEASLALTIARAETATRNLELLLAANRHTPNMAQSRAAEAPDGFAPFGRTTGKVRLRRDRTPDAGEQG